MNAVHPFQIARFNGRNPGQFYIQSHGPKAGRPMQQPSAQCFTVYTSQPHAYDVAACLYEADAYAHTGTAFPALTADSLTRILGEGLSLSFCPDALQTLRVALYEAQHARDIADQWLTYARQFARNLYTTARTTVPA